MTRNLTIILGKLAILCSVAFFSATAFAETCPTIEEIAKRHPDQQHLDGMPATDSGWVVVNAGMSDDADIKKFKFNGVKFYEYKDSPSGVPNHATGTAVSCNYIDGEQYFRMQKVNTGSFGTESLVLIVKQSHDPVYGNWHQKIEDKYYEYFCDKSIDECKFEIIPGVSYAGTCPDIKELHLDPQDSTRVVTDSGWASRFPVPDDMLEEIKNNQFYDEHQLDEVAYYPYTRKAPIGVPDYIAGDRVECRYEYLGEKDTPFAVRLQKAEGSIALIPGKDWNLWNSPRNDGAHVCWKNINECRFEVISAD